MTLWKRKMNRRLFLTVLVALVCFPCSFASAQLGGLFGGGTKVETIETEALKSMLDKRKAAASAAKDAGQPVPVSDFVVVDVRTPEEVKVSIIPGAITKAQFQKDAAKYRDKLVIPYCTVGGRSGAFAKQMAGKGMKVKNYQGSILKWVGAGLPVVTLDGKDTNRVHTHSDRHKIPSKYEQVTK